MSFKLLDQLENLTPVWKFVEAELPSEPCLNNLERLRFVICLYTNDLLLHRPRHHQTIFCLIYRKANYFPMTIWKEKNE